MEASLKAVSLRFFSLSTQTLYNGSPSVCRVGKSAQEHCGVPGLPLCYARLPAGPDCCGDLACDFAHCLFTPSGIPLQWQHGVERQPNSRRGKNPRDTGREVAEAVGLMCVSPEPHLQGLRVPRKHSLGHPHHLNLPPCNVSEGAA